MDSIRACHFEKAPKIRLRYLVAAAVILLSLIPFLMWQQGDQDLPERPSIPWDSFQGQHDSLRYGFALLTTPLSRYKLVRPRTIRLDSGWLWLSILDSPSGLFTVELPPLGRLTAQGTEFAVGNSGEEAEVLVIRGELKLSNRHGSQLGGPGTYMYMIKGTKPRKMVGKGWIPDHVMMGERLWTPVQVKGGWYSFVRACSPMPERTFSRYSANFHEEEGIFSITGDGHGVYAGIQTEFTGGLKYISFWYRASSYRLETPTTNAHIFITDSTGKKVYYHHKLVEGGPGVPGLGRWKRYSKVFDLSRLGVARLILCLKDISPDNDHQANHYKDIRIEDIRNIDGKGIRLIEPRDPLEDRWR
jgi:hypothetical protein